MKAKLFLSVIAGVFFFCTINDDNGDPAFSSPEYEENLDDTSSTDTSLQDPEDTVPEITIKNSPLNPIQLSNQVTIEFELGDSSSNTYLADTDVSVSASYGSVDESTVTTDDQGEGSFTFTPSVETVDTITISYRDYNKRATIQVSSDPVVLQNRNINIDASPYVIDADGESKSIIKVKLFNDKNQPIVGDSIEFITDHGTIGAYAITDDYGVATTELISERRDVTASVNATLLSDSSASADIEVDFSGISITTNLDPKSIVPDDSSFSRLTATLLDAAEKPVYGEPVVFRAFDTTTTRISTISSNTDTKGKAYCKVFGIGTGQDSIMLISAGDTAYSEISYSERKIMIDTSGFSNHFISNSSLTTRYRVKFLEANLTQGIADADMNVSVTSGNNEGELFAFSDTTDSDGEIEFEISNPDFATYVTVTVTAAKNGDVTNTSEEFYYSASEANKIELKGTPEVIGVKSGEAELTATVYDTNSNRVKDEVLSFQISSGPGSGERLSPATAMTDESGIARTTLLAGNTGSNQNDIIVTASNFSGIKSNKVKFTIAGPPEKITMKKNVGELEVNDDESTYSKRVSALVTDINGNPVPDGTEVNFSLNVTGYYIWELITIDSTTEDDTFSVQVPDTAFLPFEDFNDNYVKDEGENGSSDYFPRGENIVTPEDNGQFLPGPPFWDYDCDGRRNYDEASDSFTEPLVDTTMTEKEYAEYYSEDSLGFREGYGFIDIDWNTDGIPEPKTSVIIPKTVTTTNGVAATEITYAQDDALRYRVMVWCECKGLTSNKLEFRLRIEEDDAEYFDPFEGKKYR